MASGIRGMEMTVRALARLGSLGLAIVPALVGADEIYLRGGGRITGIVVERTPQAVLIETGPGRVGLPLSRIERIVDAGSALATYQQRAANLAVGDVDGWAALARWAAERDLQTQSRQAWQRVLAFDPGHPEANAALARVQMNGVWMDSDEAYRARGYVPFDGRWVTPAEHAALLREQAIEDASAQQRREAALRVREAEARAREAEARASEAEAAATYGDENGGIPYWWIFAGGGTRHMGPHPRHHGPPDHQPVAPGRRPATTPPSAIRPQATPASPPTRPGALPGPRPAAPSGAASGQGLRRD